MPPKTTRGVWREGNKVIHYANEETPSRCFVTLYKKYQSKCPAQRPEHAFYLQPLKKPSRDCWYSVMPIGHYTLAGTVSRMCKAAGIAGYKTNHSLRATAATRLYQAGVDEQLIMEKTGHRSLEGVRTYKRTTTNQQEGISDILSLTRKKKCTAHITSPPSCSTMAVSSPRSLTPSLCPSLQFQPQFPVQVHLFPQVQPLCPSLQVLPIQVHLFLQVQLSCHLLI